MAKFSSLSTAQLREIVEAKPSFSKSVIEGRSDHRLFDTLIAIAYIRIQFPESKELWELVIQKAEIYVDQFFRDKKDWEQVITWLQEIQEASQAEGPAIKGSVVKNDLSCNNSSAEYVSTTSTTLIIKSFPLLLTQPVVQTTFLAPTLNAI